MGSETRPQRVASFHAHPDSYKHWKLAVDGAVATLTLDVKEDGGLRADDYVLKQNSYDLGVDIELCDAIQRLEKGALVFAPEEDRAARVPSARDVVDGPRVLVAQASCHAPSLRRSASRFRPRTSSGALPRQFRHPGSDLAATHAAANARMQDLTPGLARRRLAPSGLVGRGGAGGVVEAVEARFAAAVAAGFDAGVRRIQN